MKIKGNSQTVTIDDMFSFEFIGDGCSLSDEVKGGIFRDLCANIDLHLGRAPGVGTPTPCFERCSTNVVLIDGKHYRLMSDAECAEHIWTPEARQAAATASGLYNCQVCGLEKCAAPGICADCLTPPAPQPISEPEKRYTTKALIEKLDNALENGYEELGETDIGDLLLETERESLCPHCNASPCLGEFDSSDCD